MQSGTVPGFGPGYSGRVKPVDLTVPIPEGQLARVEQLIEEFRAAKARQLLERAKKLWRHAEEIHRRAALDADPEQIH